MLPDMRQLRIYRKWRHTMFVIYNLSPVSNFSEEPHYFFEERLSWHRISIGY